MAPTIRSVSVGELELELGGELGAGSCGSSTGIGSSVTFGAWYSGARGSGLARSRRPPTTVTSGSFPTGGSGSSIGGTTGGGGFGVGRVMIGSGPISLGHKMPVTMPPIPPPAAPRIRARIDASARRFAAAAAASATARRRAAAAARRLAYSSAC